MILLLGALHLLPQLHPRLFLALVEYIVELPDYRLNNSKCVQTELLNLLVDIWRDV